MGTHKWQYCHYCQCCAFVKTSNTHDHPHQYCQLTWPFYTIYLQVMYVVTLFPYVLLTILLINSATLDGAADGIEFHLKPDLDRLSDEQVSVENKVSTSTNSIHSLKWQSKRNDLPRRANNVLTWALIGYDSLKYLKTVSVGYRCGLMLQHRYFSPSQPVLEVS